MFFVKIYVKGTVTSGSALLMVFSMVIAQSLVARTFGTYTLQLFDIGPQSNLVPVLGVGLLIFTYIVNISGNKFIRSEEHTSELQSRGHLVCRLLLEKTN